MSDSKKLRRLKKIRHKNLEKNFLEIQMKGQDHYIFMNERGKAQVISKWDWVAEHIRTAVLKYNFEIDKIDKLLINSTSAQLTLQAASANAIEAPLSLFARKAIA